VEKIVRKKNAIVRKMRTNNTKIQEPTSIDPENINLSILKIISWYREQNYNVDILKQWLIDAAVKLDIEDSQFISYVPDYYIIESNSYISRMFCNDVNLLESNIDGLIRKLKSYIERGKEYQKNKEIVKENRVAPIEKVKQTIELISVNVVGYLKDEDFDIIEYVVKNNLGVGYVNQLIKHLDKDTHADAIEKLSNWLVSNKKQRKPRKKKVKSVEDICKLFVCCNEFDGIKSVNPTKIIGSECVVCYHVQTKKLQVYLGKKLMVHRSMIINFDKKKSFESDLIDKKHLTELSLGGKLNVNKIIKEYDNKEKSGLTGRVTKKVLLLTVVGG